MGWERQRRVKLRKVDGFDGRLRDGDGVEHVICIDMLHGVCKVPDRLPRVV